MAGYLGQIPFGQAGFVSRISGGFGLQLGERKPHLAMGKLLPNQNGKKAFVLPTWKPYMGQPVVAESAPSTPPVSLKQAGDDFGGGALFGAVLGTAMNVLLPSTRGTRGAAGQFLGFGLGTAVVGYLLNLAFGEKWFFSSMIKVGGVFAGDALSDLVFPAPKPVYMSVPKLAGWRNN